MKKKIISSIKILLAPIIVIVVCYKLQVNIEELSHVIKNYIYFALATIVPILVTTTISANRWRTFLSMVDVHEKTSYLYGLILTSSFLGLILPSSQGYDVLRIYRIEQLHPEARGKVGSTVVVERILGLICLALIASIAWTFINQDISFLPIALLLFAICIIVISIRNDYIYKSVQHVIQSFHVAHNVCGYVSKLYEGLHKFPFNRQLVWSIFLIFLLQLSNISVVYLLFEACGYHINPIYHLCYQPVISVITMIPLTFGGIGLREGSFAFFYAQHGIPAEIMVVVSLLYYLLVIVVPSIMGGLIYLVQNVKNIVPD